jgi:hypothetical protein
VFQGDTWPNSPADGFARPLEVERRALAMKSNNATDGGCHL